MIPLPRLQPLRLLLLPLLSIGHTIFHVPLDPFRTWATHVMTFRSIATGGYDVHEFPARDQKVHPLPMTRLDDDRRRALALLAENPDGCSRAILIARGFPISLLNRLIRAGLATSRLEREERGDKAIEIVRVKITEAGRRALQ
jgi:hypothetical protein